MAEMNLSATMDAIAQRLLAAEVVAKAYGWPHASATIGSAVVDYPDGGIDYDVTYGRGSDKATFPVLVICGLPNDRTSRDVASTFVNGARSVKDALEPDLDGAVQTCRVTDAAVVVWTLAGVELLAVRFDLEVYS